MLSSAFEAHPYRRLSVGWASDIQSLRVRDAEKFYKTYYVPANITIGIVGDIDPKQARALADKYFTRLPAGPLPPIIHTVEPQQEGPRLAQIQSASQPFEVIGYKRPDQYDKDDPVFDVVSSLLAGGRTGIILRTWSGISRSLSPREPARAFRQQNIRICFCFMFFLLSADMSFEDNEQASVSFYNNLRTRK